VRDPYQSRDGFLVNSGWEGGSTPKRIGRGYTHQKYRLIGEPASQSKLGGPWSAGSQAGDYRFISAGEKSARDLSIAGEPGEATKRMEEKEEEEKAESHE